MPGIQAGEHGCDGLLQSVPFVRGDVQRIASGSATDHAVVTAVFRLAGWTPSSAVDNSFLPPPPASRTPDLTVLRI